MENTYVKVFGVLKTFEEKHTIMAHKVMPLEDLNELTAHLLEVVQCKLYFTRVGYRDQFKTKSVDFLVLFSYRTPLRI